MKLIIATHNPDKLKEIQGLLHSLPYEVRSAEQEGVTEDVIEDGVTLEQNALKKARFVTKRTNQWAIADDTGLFIDALDGQPGIYAARWAGPRATGADILAYTLSRLDGIKTENRTAQFESLVALCSPDGTHHLFQGITKGKLIDTPRGAHPEKLPYDALFIPEGESQTYAEMPYEKKSRISHRAKAFDELRKFLESHTLSH